MSLKFLHPHLLSIQDLSPKDLGAILDMAEVFDKNPHHKILSGDILASCFFEPSTRTRLSFETAMLRLGGRVIGFSEASSTSSQKGESLSDTMRVIGGFADIIVIRHPEIGSAHIAAKVAGKPVINAGDGAGEHPSQTLVDLFTIRKEFGTLEGLSIAIVGDLKYGRTIHSLVKALSLYSPKLHFISPKSLSLPEPIIEMLKKKNISFSFEDTIEKVLKVADILYMTRLQKERLQGEDAPIHYALKRSMLASAKKHLKILCPLPRREELAVDVDESPHAIYFQQAKNGVPIRMALLAMLLGKGIVERKEKYGSCH